MPAGSGHPDNLIPDLLVNVNEIWYSNRHNSQLCTQNFIISWNMSTTDVVYCRLQFAFTMHTTQELSQVALCGPVLATSCKVLQGVSDKLPLIKTYPTGLTSNADPHNLPGTNWWPCILLHPEKVNFWTATSNIIAGPNL